MRIDLSELAGEPQSFSEELVLRPEEHDLHEVVGEVEVRLEGIVRPIAPDYHVTGRVRAAAQLPCSRCLEPVAWTLDEEFSFHLSRSEPAAGEDEIALAEGDLDVAFLADDFFDLEELAAEQVVLGLPMRIVCSENCAGLCPRCGGNRNHADGCRCPEDEVDPRWEALRGVIGR